MAIFCVHRMPPTIKSVNTVVAIPTTTSKPVLESKCTTSLDITLATFIARFSLKTDVSTQKILSFHPYQCTILMFDISEGEAHLM